MISDETSNLTAASQNDESTNGGDSSNEKVMSNIAGNVPDETMDQEQNNQQQQQNQNLQIQKELENIRNFYENKLKQQQLESIRKENILIMRLTLKDQQLQDCLAQIEALKKSATPSNQQLESYLLDPALNFIFEKMKKEVDTNKSKVDEMQNEMNAWKFSADSITGKQLMAKCRQLHQENEELGKMISSGKIAKLESGLAMFKNYSESLNKSQADVEEVLNEIEENAEGFQNTVLYLQQQLKEHEEKFMKMKQIFQNCKCECRNQFLSENNIVDEPMASTEW